MSASRGYHSKEKSKTEGCLAAGVRCNIWARAQSPLKLSYHFVKGGSMMIGTRSRKFGLQLHDLVWTAGSGLSMPRILTEHPILDQLATKIVHFLVDFHSDWFPALALPPSDGRHGQLVGTEIQSVLDCLEIVPEVQAAVQVFSAVKLKHGEFLGAQIVHSTPFKSRHSAPRMVRKHSYTYRYVHIRTHTYGYVHIRTHTYTYVHIRTHTYIFVR
jgi:hypothetical protein